MQKSREVPNFGGGIAFSLLPNREFRRRTRSNQLKEGLKGRPLSPFTFPPPRGEKLPQRKKFHSETLSADPRWVALIPREGRKFRDSGAASRGEERRTFPKHNRDFWSGGAPLAPKPCFEVFEGAGTFFLKSSREISRPLWKTPVRRGFSFSSFVLLSQQ